MDVQIAKVFAAALSLISIFGVSLALANVFSSYMTSVARNPSAQPKMQTMTFIGMAVIEALGLLTVLIAFLILLT